MYKHMMFAIAAALLLTAFVAVASLEFTQAAHAQNHTAVIGSGPNGTGAAGNMTSAAGANMTK